MLSLGFSDFDFSVAKSKTGLYNRVSLGFFKIHWVRGSLDSLLGSFNKEALKLPLKVLLKMPDDAIDLVIDPGFGLSFLIGFGEEDLGCGIETNRFKIWRVVCKRLFIHLGFSDFDSFWAGMLTMVIFIHSAKKLSEILE